MGFIGLGLFFIITMSIVIYLAINFISKLFDKLRENKDYIEAALRQENKSNREEYNKNNIELRQEISNFIAHNNRSLSKTLEDRVSALIAQSKDDQTSLRSEINSQLEKMRETVNEKLQGTLEKRLHGVSKQVDDKLSQLYKELGEIQGLSSDVKGLTKLMSNVKTRGVWGEFQVGKILEDILTQSQYIKNAQVKKGSGERVEYAIKMPGRSDNAEDYILLPIDSKFPAEDYTKLLEAQEVANTEDVKRYRKNLKDIIKKEAQNIIEKYINPPLTTDFAILFLPTESLYAEILSQTELINELQRKQYRIIVSGPTTLTAILSGLYVGFQTLAIEKRSTEIRKLLSNVKRQFGLFTDILEKTEQKLSSASEELGRATKKSKSIQNKLVGIEQIEDV